LEGKAFEAVWAIDEISEGKFPIKDIESFLGHLMDHISDREITVQVKIDEVVCEMDLRGWASSDDRMNVLNSWIGDIPNHSRDELHKIRARLDQSEQRNELTDKTGQSKADLKQICAIDPFHRWGTSPSMTGMLWSIDPPCWRIFLSVGKRFKKNILFKINALRVEQFIMIDA
jgi:hypothetical protein